MRLSSFVLRNLNRHRRSVVFSIVGIVLGITSFVVFVALGQGLRKNVLDEVFVVDQIEVVPRRFEIGAFYGSGGLFGGGTGLDDYTAEDLLSIPGVRAVYPKMQLTFPAVASGGAELFGRDLWTELIADGIPPELVRDELPVRDDPSDAFRDWDGDEFLCDPAADTAGQSGWDVGCPPGRFCSDSGECVRDQCEPEDEVLAASTRRSARAAVDYLNHRLRRERGRGLEIRQIADDVLDELEGQRLPYRVTITDRLVDDARRVLPRFVVQRAASRRLSVALQVSQHASRNEGRRLQRLENEDGADPTEPDLGEDQSPDGTDPQVDEAGQESAEQPSNVFDSETPDASHWLSRLRDEVVLMGEEEPCDRPSYCAYDTRHCEMPVPVVASPFLLELYNTQVQVILSGSDRDMPALTGEALIGFSFLIKLGRGVLGRATNFDDVGLREREFRLVGWSRRAMQLGVTLPIGYVSRLNALYASDDAAEEYHSILVVVEGSEDLARIVKVVEDELDLSIGASYEQANRGSLMISLLTIGLLLISALIIALASLNIGHTFMMVIAQRRREIGVLRAVGARRIHILWLVLAEATLIGTVGAGIASGVALGIGRGADYVMNRYVPDFPFKPDSLFSFDLWIFGLGVAIAVLFSLIGAFFPAWRASRLDPAEALRGH